MGSLPHELSLDFRPTFVPKTISGFLKEVSMIGNASERVSKLDDFVRRLEEEMRKIDAFKRELPLCMFLLNDAIGALKDDAMQCSARNVQPVLEEFIPLKEDCDKNDGGTSNNKKEKDCKDKKNWMSSVQLWNTDDIQQPSTDFRCDRKQASEIDPKRNEAENGVASEDLFRTCRNGTTAGRTFMPFKAYHPSYSVTPARMEDKEELPVHGLSLVTPGIKYPKEESASSGSRSTSGRAVSFSAANVQSNIRSPPQQPTSRKQRRCWSPELHRRFVNALQQLGGSQVATPKQIRELMQVDGLTNDEVKSHLQKYRLHTRRVPATAATPANKSVVVLGGLWMSQDQDQYADSSKATSSHSGSPQGPLQLTGTGGDDESEEDAKSESYSWKGHTQNPGKDDV